jgi:hypothetical protein
MNERHKRSIPEEEGTKRVGGRIPVKELSSDLGLVLEIRSVVVAVEERRGKAVKRSEEAEVGEIEGKAERSEDIFHLLLVVVAIAATFAIFACKRNFNSTTRNECLQDKKKVDRDWRERVS